MDSRIDSLPSALDALDDLEERLAGRTPALFLDYDGTLSPIVRDPGAADLPEPTRRALHAAARQVPVAVVSGRGLADVRRRVGLEGIWYVGSHGFELRGPGGEREEKAPAALSTLDEAEAGLRKRFGAADAPAGVRVERKRFAIAVHYREVDDDRDEEVRRAVAATARRRPGLRTSAGKQVVELRPDVPWDKGRAVRWLWERLGLSTAGHHPVYVGDDVTDEDAFRVLADDLDGTGVVVRGESDGRETLATFSLAGHEEVRTFVEVLAGGL